MEKTVIELSNVTKKIGAQVLLNSVSLQLTEGHVYGFAGQNGAGKTVLLETILGFVRPTSGNVIVNGIMVRHDQMFAPNVGFALGTDALLPMFDGATNLGLVARTKAEAEPGKIQALLKQVGLNPVSKQKVHDYSLGMRQRLNVACALVNDDPIVILDEPTNGLDDAGQRFLSKLVDQLRTAGKTVLLTSHNREFLMQLSDEIFLVNAGNVKRAEAADEVD
ncbi:ABC transporter ATP-binding protein [Lacticaseibacillus hulanensis]|jgi:ABC-2 type transport system ATP-binding protein|uniref:ABC transporter ATP-binding protein n=1 Tax=Lacticaseibacillus hulanensis TaxID=2493111 RepID=UPI000FD89FAE|nr:ABC transporter ATP-binding protein [Lacticaseibacillus hulanensis]